MLMKKLAFALLWLCLLSGTAQTLPAPPSATPAATHAAPPSLTAR
ncbi:hypothetical protein [Pseudodesulfovibrio sp.]|nr:hypothetical protein [Pseudodesulfovibrio sp.]MDD3311607.1 hypothetical protein [Pseudodesulfovibrio sp.]